MGASLTKLWISATLVSLVCAATPAAAGGQSLRGSGASIDLQNRVATQHDFTYLRNSAHVERFVALGLLERVRPNGYFELKAVSFPYARPEVRLFIERLSRQYVAACGDKLVITSITRPKSRQPRNASANSVHPTGMAVDIRRTNNMACRTWLEDVLLHLERTKVAEATRERRPPHYHVAIFPKPYAKYVASIRSEAPAGDQVRYRVRSGDSLWTIAREHGTTVKAIRQRNKMSGTRIYAGQLLSLPTTR